MWLSRMFCNRHRALKVWPAGYLVHCFSDSAGPSRPLSLSLSRWVRETESGCDRPAVSENEVRFWRYRPIVNSPCQLAFTPTGSPHQIQLFPHHVYLVVIIKRKPLFLWWIVAIEILILEAFTDFGRKLSCNNVLLIYGEICYKWLANFQVTCASKLLLACKASIKNGIISTIVSQRWPFLLRNSWRFIIFQ